MAPRYLRDTPAGDEARLNVGPSPPDTQLELRSILVGTLFRGAACSSRVWK